MYLVLYATKSPILREVGSVMYWVEQTDKTWKLAMMQRYYSCFLLKARRLIGGRVLCVFRGIGSRDIGCKISASRGPRTGLMNDNSCIDENPHGRSHIVDVGECPVDRLSAYWYLDYRASPNRVTLAIHPARALRRHSPERARAGLPAAPHEAAGPRHGRNAVARFRRERRNFIVRRRNAAEGESSAPCTARRGNLHNRTSGPCGPFPIRFHGS
jgi:hypothetical protein